MYRSHVQDCHQYKYLYINMPYTLLIPQPYTICYPENPYGNPRHYTYPR